MNDCYRAIFEYISAHQGCKCGDIRKGLGIGRQTLHSRLGRMVQAGYLRRVGDTGASCYYAEKQGEVLDELPAEYLKVRSIFRVGERYAAQMGVA